MACYVVFSIPKLYLHFLDNNKVHMPTLKVKLMKLKINLISRMVMTVTIICTWICLKRKLVC